MPLYLDEHDHIQDLKADALAQAHARDVEVGAAYGVNYLRYWFDEATGKVFCLVDAPSPEVAEEVHRLAHGLVADRVLEVTEGG